MKSTVSAVIFLFLFCVHAMSANRIFNVHSGLSENTVRAIIQDSTGYMWFATKDGLCRYNGREFTSYGSSSESDSSSPLNIETILLHEDGRRIWVASRTALVLFDPDRNSISDVRADTGNGPQAIRSCLSVCYDTDRNLWVGTVHGLYMMEHGSGKWKVYSHSEYSQLPSDRITKIHCDSRGILWVGTEMGLARYDHLSDSFRPVSADLGHKVNITAISEDREGNIWIGTWYDGIAVLDIKKSIISFCRLEIRPERVRAIFHRSASDMFICSDSGLYLYDRENRGISPFKFEAWMPDKSYYSFYEDREGGYWIGTYFNGVCYISPKSRNMGTLRPESNCAVSQFCELPDRSILIATENYGLISFDPSENKTFPAPFPQVCDNIHSLCISGNDLWVGTFGKGLARISLDSGRLATFTADSPNSIPNNHIYSLCRTKDDEIIVGTMRGACIYSYGTGTFRKIDELGDKFIYDIAEDNYGKVWFATYGFGAYSLDTETGSWKRYSESAENPDSLCGNYVIRLHIDSKDRLWFCTEGKGICRYDYREDRFVVPEYRTPDSKLPNSVVFGILEANDGQLWMSTNNGLIRYDEATGECRQYSYSDGIQSKQFNYRSSFRSSDGRLYFGGIDGFNTFYPDRLFENTTSPGISANISYGSGKSRTCIACADLSSVIIPRNIRSFSLNMECLSFVSPDNNSFKYRFNSNQWTYTNNPEVLFVNMKPGKYTLAVKSINGDGYESSEECRLILHVQPPILQTALAKIIYIIILCFLAYWLISDRIRRKNLAMARRFEAMRLKNEQESYDAKIQFFTQIAHEIKTPVTLIKAPLEIIRKSRRWDGETARNLDIISTNTDRLMSLIKELLDFKKISKDGYRLNIETIDAVILAKETIKGFTVSDDGTPEICFSSSAESIICNADSGALVKIISNLVSNSMRFAKARIDVILGSSVIGQDRYLKITVRDDGPGVPDSERGKIFDAFYQSASQSAENRSKGVGLGLSLVRLLTEKHNGKVYINGEYTGGCEICVEIPCGGTKEAEQPSEKTETSIVHEEEPAAGEQKTRILIVEDNQDLLKFLCGNISGNTYTATGVCDGTDALEKLKEQDYDIIVSDIAMPNMDGFGLLKHVRSDNMLCHIPFILLSAESSIESKIEGLEKGADAYIEKPFSMTHFYAVIENLISSRRLLQKKFSSEPLEKYNTSGMSGFDAEWLKKLDSLIYAGMNDDDFSIDRLADQLYVSRSYLQRKLRGLVNMSANNYIKLLKLKKAAELLSEGHYRINEVCYIVGFNNPSYFANCFHKQFGVLPTDFAISHQTSDNNQ